jgi:hypothetical protein
MINESRKITKQPWFRVLAATSVVLVLVVVVLFRNSDNVSKQGRETPIPVPSIAPFVEQTITEEEMIALEKEALSPAGVDTSDWPTYTNKKYGFSFKYPEGIQIEGTINGSAKYNHLEYADQIRFLSYYSDDKMPNFLMVIRAMNFKEMSNDCIAVPGVSIKEYVEAFRLVNIYNNVAHEEMLNAKVSDISSLTTGKEEGHKLIFEELVYDNCKSMSWGELNNQPFLVYRVYGNENLRLKAINTYPKNEHENPLYQVMLDTLEIKRIEK